MKMNLTNFNNYYQTWLEQLHELTTDLSRLLSAAPDAIDDECTRQLVQKSMTHYADLYRAKSVVAEAGDVLALFAAPWASSLERSLHWVTGFRPTTVFHLVYTESSARLESHMANFLRGHRTDDLGELMAGQLTRVSDLQCGTVKAENEISGRLREWQEELVGLDWAARTRPMLLGLRRAAGRVDRLREVVGSADELRIRAITEVVGLLTTRQAAEFPLAFSQLQFGIQSGMQQDGTLPAAA